MPIGAARAGIFRQKALAEVISNGLVAEWRFDDGSGQVLTDYTGNGHHGQLGSTTGSDTEDPTWTSEGLSFDGGDYVVVADDSALSSTAGRTMIAVVNFGSVGQQYMISKYDTGLDQRELALWTENGSVVLNGSGDGTVFDQVTGNTTGLDGAWHMYTGRFDAGELAVFVDDTADGTKTVAFSSLHDGTADMFIGDREGDLNRTLSGSMAYGLLYNRALTNTEVADNYAAVKDIVAGRGITLP